MYNMLRRLALLCTSQQILNTQRVKSKLTSRNLFIPQLQMNFFKLMWRQVIQ
jgi:hypothetical protein